MLPSMVALPINTPWFSAIAWDAGHVTIALVQEEHESLKDGSEITKPRQLRVVLSGND